MSAPTKRQLAARHLRRLRTMRNQLIEMSRQWEEFDQFAVNRLEELSDQVENTALDLVEDTECEGETL